MQAVIFNDFGEPADVLRMADVPEPQPQAGEVSVRMLVSPINPSDLMTVRGQYITQPRLPAIPGYEGVGIVESSGGGLMGRWLQGKRVAVLNGAGGNWGEKVVIPSSQAIPLPADLPVEQAAMFFVNPATAYVMTHEVLKIPAGAWLLQTAAGSALGRMVIRLGKEQGFRTLNVIRSESQVEELKRIGADEVVVFSPEKGEDAVTAFQEQVRKITGGAGVPFAVDPVGGVVGSAVISTLAIGGRMLLFGTLANESLSLPGRFLMTANATIEGFWLKHFMQQLSLIGKLAIIRKISRLQRNGILAAEVAETFPLQEIVAAVNAAEVPQRRGKILLNIGKQ